MSTKPKVPKQDPETVARQKAAEERADVSRLRSQRELVSSETRAIFRNFGRLVGANGGFASILRPPTISGGTGFTSAGRPQGNFFNNLASRLVQ